MHRSFYPIDAAFSEMQRAVDSSLAHAVPVYDEEALSRARTPTAGCLKKRWVIAVADSVGRIAFSNFAERLMGERNRSACMPAWRFQGQAACNPMEKVVPCVVDLENVVDESRITFVWSFGYAIYTDANRTTAEFMKGRGRSAARAVSLLLEDACAPRTMPTRSTRSPH